MKTKTSNSLRVEADLSQGADYLYIDDVGGGRVRVEVGHSCVVFMNKVVPVEFVTAAIVHALHDKDVMGRDHPRTPKEFLAEFYNNYDRDYVEKLVGAVEETRRG